MRILFLSGNIVEQILNRNRLEFSFNLFFDAENSSAKDARFSVRTQGFSERAVRKLPVVMKQVHDLKDVYRCRITKQANAPACAFSRFKDFRFDQGQANSPQKIERKSEFLCHSGC